MSHRNLEKFIFIHINKTGGTSVSMALNIPNTHKTALEIIDEIGRRNWNNNFTFTVVRNPWDKVVSHYHYRVQTNQTSLGENPISFKEWVQRTYGEQDSLYYDKPKMFMPQVNWISDKSGNIIVNRIMHFENIDEEFTELSKILNINKDVALPHVKSSKRGHYRDYYDENSIQIVQNWFMRDIEEFGYKF